MADNKGIIVFGEIVNNNLSSVTTEILGGGRKLADELQEELSCVLITNELGDTAKQAIEYGADKVFTVVGTVFKDYLNAPFAAALAKVTGENNPRLILFGQTSTGRDLAPTMAFTMGVGLSVDCLDIKLNADKKFELTRSVYGGNAQATFTSDQIPQIATIRQKAMAPLAPDSSRKGEIIEVKVDVDAGALKTKVLDTVKEEVVGIKLEDATVIVSGGRGIGSEDGFKQLEQLATVFKGAVGATRPPCDNAWWPETSQVGLTGKIVSPDLYIAVAISGASQHMAGCSGAKNIIAINKDPEANIFKFARFGIVGDWKQVIPAFGEKIKKLIAG
jgi:electron transfer flavoprotein alpha subunit